MVVSNLEARFMLTSAARDKPACLAQIERVLAALRTVFAKHARCDGMGVAASWAMTAYWAQPPAEVARALGVTLDGLSFVEAASRLERYGANEIHTRPAATRLRVLARQLRSPLVLLLVFAAIASTVSGEWVDASGYVIASELMKAWFYRAGSRP